MVEDHQPNRLDDSSSKIRRGLAHYSDLSGWASQAVVEGGRYVRSTTSELNSISPEPWRLETR